MNLSRPRHLTKKRSAILSLAASVGSQFNKDRDACRLSLVTKLSDNIEFLKIDNYSQIIWMIMKMANVDKLLEKKLNKMPNRNRNDLDKILIMISENMNKDESTILKRLIGKQIGNRNNLKTNIIKINDSITNLLDNLI